MRHRSKRWSAGHLHAPAATPMESPGESGTNFTIAGTNFTNLKSALRGPGSIFPVSSPMAASAIAWMLHGCCMDVAWMLHACRMNAA